MIIASFAKLIAQLVKIILISRWLLIIFKPRALLIPPLCSVKKQEKLRGSPLLYPSSLSGARAIILRVLAGVSRILKDTSAYKASASEMDMGFRRTVTYSIHETEE